MTNYFLESQTFNRSIPRTIDTETMVDLVQMITYSANRIQGLEEVGLTDLGDPVEILYGYILDALGAPKDSETFSREPLYELFFSDYLIDSRWDSPEAFIVELKTVLESK